MKRIYYEFNISKASEWSGVYAIFIDDHVYIGSTKRCLSVRMKEHEKFLKQNKHSNSRMQSWFNECQTITFMVLEYCSQRNVCKREQYYIDKYKPDINIVQHVAKY